QVDMLDDRSAYEVSSTTDTWTTGATGGVVYIAAWADGTNKVRWGHTSGSGATRFTKWSQIKGTCRKELVNVKEWPSATTGAYTATDWLNYGTAGQQSYMKWHYTIISTECLIEND
ncbi:MAG: hypothetical protein KKC77_19190, partial [Proteobacteria bacterium]|nr:hypothetical protein [Pseudomonadota bacterium]